MPALPWGAPAEEMPLEKWQSVLDVNLTGAFLFCQAVGRGMIARGSGSIVNVASIAGLRVMATDLYHELLQRLEPRDR